jgi:hypothetical protein
METYGNDNNEIYSEWNKIGEIIDNIFICDNKLYFLISVATLFILALLYQQQNYSGRLEAYNQGTLFPKNIFFISLNLVI